MKVKRSEKIHKQEPPSTVMPQFLYNEYIMSVRRYQPDAPLTLDKHRSIEQPLDDRPYHLRRFNRSRNKANTKSLQSIEITRGSTIIPQKQHSQRRKLLSLERNDHTEPNTERGLHLQQSVKHIPPHRPLRTIQSDNIQVRERQIKDCIQLMQGVLSQLQQQKSQKTGIGGGSVGTEGSQSKFQSYVRKVVNLRQDSKVIILRKAKTKSLAGNNPTAIRSTAILNANRFDTIRDPPKAPVPAKRKERPYFAGGGLDELECSAIQGSNNQSSFISAVGKEALMRELEDQREKSTLEGGNKLVQRLKNHRKLKNVFPDGFF